jgi:four helix bundle protein
MITEYKPRFEGRFIRFGVSLLALARQLPRGPIVRHVADQLFRSGSSAGANVTEAQSAQSTADFISKMEIALKEIREAGYWLRVTSEGKLLPTQTLASAIQECEELTAILAKSVITAKAKRQQR